MNLSAPAVAPPRKNEAEPDRTSAENLAVPNYYMGKDDAAPHKANCRSRRKEALTSPSEKGPSLVTSTPTKPRAAIAAAYGWPADLSDVQNLEKLLDLKLERAAEEAKSAKVKKQKTTCEKREDEIL